MKRFSCAVVVAAAAAAALPGSAGAALADCDDYKKASVIRVVGVDCADAQRVVKAWIRRCKDEDRCSMRVAPGSGTAIEYACRTKNRKKAVAVSCSSSEFGYSVKFKYPD